MKKIDNFENFSEGLNNPLLTIDDFLESFSDFKVDWIEDKMNDFAHTDAEDFDEYIIVDDSIAIEKEYVLIDDDDNEIFVYTNTDNKINGYAFNKD